MLLKMLTEKKLVGIVSRLIRGAPEKCPWSEISTSLPSRPSMASLLIFRCIFLV